ATSRARTAWPVRVGMGAAAVMGAPGLPAACGILQATDGMSGMRDGATGRPLPLSPALSHKGRGGKACRLAWHGVRGTSWGSALALLEQGQGGVLDHVFLAADHATAAHFHENLAGRYAVLLLGALGEQQEGAVDTAVAHGQGVLVAA